MKTVDPTTLTNKQQTDYISQQLQIEIPKRWPGARVFRRNVGTAVGMETVNAAIHAIECGNPYGAIQVLKRRPVRFGTPGEADIQGWVPINGLAVCYGCEVKVGYDKLTPEQDAWREALLRAGGIHVVARDVENSLKEFERQVEAKRGYHD